MKQITHWSIVLDIVEAGLNKDVEKVRNYAELLASRLEETDDATIATRIHRRLQRTPSASRPGFSTSMTLSPQSVFAPVDPESRSAFMDEVTLSESEPLVLPQRVRDEVERLIKLQRLSDKFLRAGIPVPRSLLLYGPPGTGKSSTARYIARQLRLPLLMVRLDAVMSSFLGTTAKNLRSVFEYASKRGALLFLDEFDAVAKMRDDTNEVGEIKRIVNSLIQNLDAFPGQFVIAATNHEHLLDPAIWRRFDAIVRVPAPGPMERQEMLIQFFGDSKTTGISSGFLDIVTTLTDGLTGADLSSIVVRTQQEKLLQPETPVLQILTKEIWRRIEGNQGSVDLDPDDRAGLVRFIDSKLTTSPLSTRTVEAFTGIPHTTVMRLRRSGEESNNHVR